MNSLVARIESRLVFALIARILLVSAVQAVAVALVRRALVPAQFPPFLLGEITPVGALHCAVINAFVVAVAFVERAFGKTRLGQGFCLFFPFAAFVFCLRVDFDPLSARLLYLVMVFTPIALFAIAPLPGTPTSFDADAS